MGSATGCKHHPQNPSPFPRRTETSSEALFATATSGVPSAFRSPSASENGASCAGKLAAAPKAPWSRIAALSYRRLAHLLGAELVVDREALADLEQYGLGTVRSLEEYQEFAGVDFKARWIASSASERRADTGRRRPRERS